MGWPKIELRLSDVEPPDPDIPKTIYRDRFNLPDPMLLGITIRYFNWDDVSLYFRVTGLASGYTFGTVDLGALGSGGNAYENLDQFASRAKPAGEVEEEITLILRAYTDAGYTTLKWTYERVVHIKIIDSNDPSYTIDALNNFDDGTVQGWAVANEANNDATYPRIFVSSDYALSPPYSLTMQMVRASAGNVRARYYKSFTTPNRNYVYAILDFRVWPTRFEATNRAVGSEERRDSTPLIKLGEPWDTAVTDHEIPQQRWVRYVVPLPKNTTLEVQLAWEGHTPGGGGRMDSYLDDFKIISKD